METKEQNLTLVTISAYGQQGLVRFGDEGGARGEGKESFDPSRTEVVSGDVFTVKEPSSWGALVRS